MSDWKNPEHAKAAFATACQALDQNQWNYKKDEEKLIIECGARGEDLPMDITIRVDAERMLVMLLSHLPFVVQEDKRLEVAAGISAINNVLVDGCFDYDITSGHMFFRMTNSFIESKLGIEAFTYMLYCSCQTIDEYNDKLLMLAKGMLSIEQLLKSLTNE